LLALGSEADSSDSDFSEGSWGSFAQDCADILVHYLKIINIS
jgi:hypothetical protein